MQRTKDYMKQSQVSSLYDEQGIVSILIMMVFIIVISITVMGFAQHSRREQRAALDRQLSSQAYYAAESGVNDASKTIDTVLAAGGTVPSKTTCPPDATYTANNVIDPTLYNGSGRVQYTCLLVNPTPSALQSSIALGTSRVFPIISSTTMNFINISWQNTDTTNNSFSCPATPGDFKPSDGGANQWGCSLPVLRLDLVYASSFGGYTNLVSGSPSWTNINKTFYLYPQSSGGVNSSTTSNGQVIPVTCTQSGSQAPTCTISLDVGTAGTTFYTRILPIYTSAKVAVSATGPGPSFAQAVLQNSQVVIDVTGRANDVLRRIKVYKDISGLNSSLYPDYAIQSTYDLCKMIDLYAGREFTESGDGACVYPG